MRYTTLLALAVASVQAFPPLKASNNANKLSRREDNSWIAFSYCNGCTPDGGGGASCRQTIYAHFGEGRDDCDDKASEFTNKGYCGTEEGTKIDTPDGEDAGEWYPADTCTDPADDRTELGSIWAGDTEHKCYAWNEDYDIYCLGVDYACQYNMWCD